MREECQKFQNICAIFEELFDEQSEALPLKLFNYSNLSSYQTSWNFIIFWFIITPPLLELLSASNNNKKKGELQLLKTKGWKWEEKFDCMQLLIKYDMNPWNDIFRSIKLRFII